MSEMQQRLQLALKAAHIGIWDASVSNGNVLDGTVAWSPDGPSNKGATGSTCTAKSMPCWPSARAICGGWGGWARRWKKSNFGCLPSRLRGWTMAAWATKKS